MSTEFYISNRIKKREVTSLNSFWEKQLIPELKKHITDYCNELNGQYINNDVANRIIDSKISPISSVMDDSFNYETLIGTSYKNGKGTLFQWEGESVDGHVICDEVDVVEFFSNRENQIKYCIMDDYGKEYTLNEFLARIKTRK